jgi:hypothetical protein
MQARREEVLTDIFYRGVLRPLLLLAVFLIGRLTSSGFTFSAVSISPVSTDETIIDLFEEDGDKEGPPEKRAKVVGVPLGISTAS